MPQSACYDGRRFVNSRKSSAADTITQPLMAAIRRPVSYFDGKQHQIVKAAPNGAAMPSKIDNTGMFIG
jgi:hypothetical protein